MQEFTTENLQEFLTEIELHRYASETFNLISNLHDRIEEGLASN